MNPAATDIHEHATRTRNLAAQLDTRGRADLLLQLTQAVYDAVKYDNPEGGGLDGRDGAERQSLGTVVDTARDHEDACYRSE